MHSVPMDIFFSCSFADTDKDLNRFFLAICKALSLRAMNVSTGSTRTPPAEAKDQIERAQALIAICPRRTRMEAGDFVMPPAVRDEITIAFATETPLLMIIEDGVDASGFQPSIGTLLQFKRTELTSPEFIEKAVEAIHNIKLYAIGALTGGTSGLPESHADFITHLVELRSGANGLTWQYSTVKKLIYSQASRRSFPVGVWATVPVENEESQPNLDWRIALRNSSRNITLEQVIGKHTPSCVEARIKLNPPPEEGDFIEYATVAESPFLNPIWQDDIKKDSTTIHLNDGAYRCCDGLIFIHRTKKATIEFRLTKDAGLEKSDIRPFVGSYSTTVDYEVESEIERASVRVEDFGTILSVRLEIDSPLPGHLYGIAWNPKKNPAPVSPPAHIIGTVTTVSDQTSALIGEGT